MNSEPISVDELALGLNRDWAELLSTIHYESVHHSTSELANEKDLARAVRAMNARHKIRVNSAILKMKNSRGGELSNLLEEIAVTDVGFDGDGAGAVMAAGDGDRNAVFRANVEAR